jgi:hypothetical protein
MTPIQKIIAWIKALRSDEYLQGRSYLEYHCPSGGVEFCCLGVYREIGFAPISQERSTEFTTMLNDQDWRDLEPILGCQDVWATRNDAGWTFEAIAEAMQNDLDNYLRNAVVQHLLEKEVI